MISTPGHTAVASNMSKTSMSERQSLLGLGSKAKQIVENVINYFHRESAADTTSAILQTVQPTGVGLSTVYKIRSEAKYIGGLFTFNSRFFYSRS